MTRDLARRVGAFVIALLLVSTVTVSGVVPGASPVGDASAELSSECSLLGIGDGWELVYNTVTGNDQGCHWDEGTSGDYSNLTATDAYANALAMGDAQDSYTTTTQNFLEDARTVAYSKAKIEMVNRLNNGTSASATKSYVNETVENYYSRVDKEIITDWNHKAQQVVYLNQTAGLSIRVYNYDNPSSSWQLRSGSNLSIEEYNYTLPNGSTTTINMVNHTASGDRIAPWGDGNVHLADFLAVDPSDTTNKKSVLYSGHYGKIGNFDFGYGHEGGGPTASDWTGETNRNLLNETRLQPQQVKDNMAPYVDEVYAQYAVGELNSSDLATIDPAVIGQEASTELSSTGYYGHAAIMLASIGASGNVNASHTIETGDGTVLNGTLYYTGDDAPTNGWATNTTYNISDYNGTFYMALQKQDGNATIADLADYGANWTITEATNTQTGETLNVTKVNTYTYDSTNASALADEIDRLRELRQEYEEQLAASGGSSSGGGLSTEVIGGAILVGAAAVLLIQREGRQ